MKIKDVLIKTHHRGDTFEIIPIGDVHIGARNCAEKPLKKMIKEIIADDRKYVIGGGDILDAVIPQDKKRFDFDTLPDWMVEGDALNTREKLNDILNQQYEHAIEIFKPLAETGRLLGLVEGNHEYTIRKYYSRAIHKGLCRRLGVDDLTDESLLRFRFSNHGTSVIIIYIRHGYGGGRTPGAEPNKLDRMLDEWEIADICFSGHTHTFDILPPKPVLEIPRRGSLLPECTCRYRWAGNWGCWLYSHSSGASSYASRACYPARPLLTCKAVVRPFARQFQNSRERLVPHIEIRSITL